MSETVDFERAWLGRLSAGTAAIAGAASCRKIMAGSEGLSSRSAPGEVIAWTQEAMERLDALVEEPQRRGIMTGCACHYPSGELAEIRQVYRTTGDLDLVHGMLQERFEQFLKQTLGLDDALFGEVVGRGWGLAGIKQGQTVIATKIPRSEYLVQYLREGDTAIRRQLYCHCPRVRQAVELGVVLSPTYCDCGAGYYQDIWERILRRPVRVELVESVLQGGDVCRVAIHLDPADGGPPGGGDRHPTPGQGLA